LIWSRALIHFNTRETELKRPYPARGEDKIFPRLLSYALDNICCNMHNPTVTKTLNERILKAAKIASRELEQANVPHALCGGLAVEFYGYPRMTADVHFAVGDEAFHHHADGLVTLKVPIVSVDGIAIDFVSSDFETGEALDGIPVVSLPTLIVMKLRAGRQRDIADLVELIKRGAVAPETIEVPDSALVARWQRVQRLASKEVQWLNL
jgi:hypothetical protein